MRHIRKFNEEIGDPRIIGMTDPDDDGRSFPIRREEEPRRKFTFGDQELEGDDIEELFDNHELTMKEKADKYDEIESKIASFYDEEDPENENTDLTTIGEYICSYFGYI